MRSPSSHLGAAGPAGQRVGRSLAKPWKREGRRLPTAPSSRGSKLRPQRWGLDSRVPGPVSTTTRVLVCLGTLTLSSRCPAGLCAPCFQLKITCWFKLDILLTVCPSGWLALGTGPALSPSPQHLLRPLVYSRCSTHSFDVNIAHGASLIAQLVENPPAMRETWVPSLGWEDPLEGATHASVLAWSIPVDRGAWQVAAHGVAASGTTERLTHSTHSTAARWKHTRAFRHPLCVFRGLWFGVLRSRLW